jgi:hypothetical protein
MGGVAAYMGGQATWAAVNDLFPNRDTTTDLKRKLGIGLSEDQVGKYVYLYSYIIFNEHLTRTWW